MRYLVALCALLAAPAFAGSEVGDYRGLPADLAAAATDYDLAQFKSDRAALDRLLAEDYLFTDPGRKTHDKAQAIADATAPGIRILSVTLSEPVFKVWADGAVLGGMVDARKRDHGKEVVQHARFVDVWARRDGRWQVIFTQADRAD